LFDAFGINGSKSIQGPILFFELIRLQGVPAIANSYNPADSCKKQRNSKSKEI